MRSKPKPYGNSQPLLLNAGQSPAGQEFALRNCDAFFTSVRGSEYDEKTGIITPDIGPATELLDSLRSRAAAHGRTIGIYTNVNVICRPTQKEAIDYYRYVLKENADWDAVDNQVTELYETTRDLSSPDYQKKRWSVVRHFPFIGSPDRVAELFLTLSQMGFDGIGMTMVNYIDEMPFFCSEIVPRLKHAGLRTR